jgi:WD40 repeat protein
MEIWNQATKCANSQVKVLWTVKEQSDAIDTLAFSFDRKMLASGGRDGSGCLWDMTSSRPRAVSVFRKVGDSFRSFAFSPNRQFLAAGTAGGNISLYSLAMKTAQEVRVLRGARGPINSLCFSPDNKLLAGGGDDQSLRVWEPGASSGGDARILLPGHTKPIHHLAFAPHGQNIATAGADSSARVWAFGPIRPNQKTFLQHRGPVSSVSFSQDGRTLAASQKDGAILLWDLSSSKSTVQNDLAGHAGGTRLVLIVSETETLVSVGDREVTNWSTRTGRARQKWELPEGEAFSLALTPDGRYLARGRADGTVEVFRVAEKRAQ